MTPSAPSRVLNAVFGLHNGALGLYLDSLSPASFRVQEGSPEPGPAMQPWDL